MTTSTAPLPLPARVNVAGVAFRQAAVLEVRVGYVPRALTGRLLARQEQHWAAIVVDVHNGDFRGLTIELRPPTASSTPLDAVSDATENGTEAGGVADPVPVTAAAVAAPDASVVAVPVRQVLSKTGRRLGTLIEVAADEVVVAGPRGTVRYPATLVVIA